MLRQALAFPMYGAAAWLVWVLSQQAGPHGVLATLAGAVLIAFGAWALGLSEQAEAEARGRRLGRAIAVAALLGALAVLPGISAARAPSASIAADGTEAFSAARLASLIAAKRAVFVDATAAWCITCKVNERLALTARVRAAFAADGVTFLVAELDATGRGDHRLPAGAGPRGRAAECILSRRRGRAGWCCRRC